MRINPRNAYFQPEIVTEQTLRNLQVVGDGLPEIVVALQDSHVDEPIFIVLHGTTAAGLAHDESNPMAKTDILGRTEVERISDIDALIFSRWGQGLDPDHAVANVMRKSFEERGLPNFHPMHMVTTFESYRILQQIGEAEWANLMLASLFLSPVYVLDDAGALLLQRTRQEMLTSITLGDWQDAVTTYRKRIVEYSSELRRPQLLAALGELALQEDRWRETRRFEPPTLAELKSIYLNQDAHDEWPAALHRNIAHWVTKVLSKRDVFR